MSTTHKTTVLHFGAFELDLEAGRLLKNGRMVRLQPQPFRLLCLLVGQPGRLVSREEIQAALWKDETFVDFEQGVNFAVKQVRDALGDRAESSVYIQTVPRRGRSEEHTSELQSRLHLVCRLLLEKKKKNINKQT